MTILFMTFFITNICWFLFNPHFILKVDHWQNNSHSAKRQIKTATVISALQRKTLRHLTVYIYIYILLRQQQSFRYPQPTVRDKCILPVMLLE